MPVLCDDCDGTGVQRQVEWDPVLEYEIQTGVICRRCKGLGQLEEDDGAN